MQPFTSVGLTDKDVNAEPLFLHAEDKINQLSVSSHPKCIVHIGSMYNIQFASTNIGYVEFAKKRILRLIPQCHHRIMPSLVRASGNSAPAGRKTVDFFARKIRDLERSFDSVYTPRQKWTVRWRKIASSPHLYTHPHPRKHIPQNARHHAHIHMTTCAV